LDARIVRELKGWEKKHGIRCRCSCEMLDLNAADLADLATIATTTVIPQQLEQELGIDLSDDKSFRV
jgi:hypothetical protein